MRSRFVIPTLCLLMGAPMAAQQVQVGLTADTIRVGDIVGVAVQVSAPAGAELIVPDTLDLSGDLENAARRRVRLDSLADGTLHYVVTFPITAWRPGTHALPTLQLSLRTAGQQQPITVTLPELDVLSVLPADTAGVEARPPRDVWGASRLWWPIVLLAVLAAITLGALFWWWRQRRRSATESPVEAPLPVIPPREWALQELARIGQAGWLERNEYRRFYIELSVTLRRYVAMLDGAWSTDLTTPELSARVRLIGADPKELEAILQRSDLVKFARQDPGRERPRADLTAARVWVETFEKPFAFAEAA
ncbi:MAG: DUF4381 family protein [Longimicrobiales bacterium]